MFFYNLETSTPRDFLDAEVRHAANNGIHLYSTTFDWWPWDSSEDYAAADRQMDLFLKTDPDAVFLLRIDVGPPATWSGWKNRERLRETDDIRYANGSSVPVSAASETYHQAFLSALRRLIRHYEASSYAGHILGYHVTGQNSGEWFANGYWQHGPDYSQANTQAFRGWLKARYADDASLAKAWGRKGVTLATARIPVFKKGRFPIHDEKRGKIDAFYRLPKERDWVDYALYMSDLTSQRLLEIAHVIRVETAGKRLITFFYGYVFELDGSISGHLRMDRLLRSPDIDVLVAPFSYTGRDPGGAGNAMTALDSVAAHGKLWIDEDDLRTYLDHEGEPDVRRPANSAETASVLARNLATALVHRAGTWWMDLKGIGSFDDPQLWRVMADYGLPLYSRLNRNPQPFRPAVAVIVDERSVAFQKNDREMTLQRKSLRDAIAKSGASVGYYYLEDFLEGTVPRCPAYFFVNEFYLDDDQIAKIRARLESEHATAIWQYATGYLGPAGADVRRSSQLTGIHLVRSDGRTGGLSYAPRLAVADPNAVEIGRYQSDGRLSAVSKNTGSFQSVFVGNTSLSPAVLRMLLERAGVHIWSDSEDVIRTDGQILAIHSSGPGPRKIHLPAATAIATLGGEILARAPDPLEISFDAAGETRWFLLLH
jgi:hypothetical protein